jgi:signal transduction histidine kinase
VLRPTRIRSKLAAAMAVPILAAVVCGGLVYRDLDRARIGGSIDLEIDRYRGVVTDVEARELSLSEAHATVLAMGSVLTAVEIGNITPAAADTVVADLRSRISELERVGEERRAELIAAGAAGVSGVDGLDARVASTLVGEIAAWARQYHEVVRTELDPAVADHDRDRALRVIAERLDPLVEAQDGALDALAYDVAWLEATDHDSTQSFLRNRLLFIAGVLALVALITWRLALALVRNIARPIEEVATAARRAAEVELPRIVDELHRARGAAHVDPPAHIAVHHPGEIVELARSFDRLQRTAFAMAYDERRLLRQTEQVFTTLGRRNRTLANHALVLIGALQDDGDGRELTPEHRADLDHIETAMLRLRRGADGLLALAGGRSPAIQVKRGHLPIAEIIGWMHEELGSPARVVITHVDDSHIQGGAATDVVQLLSELVDNAMAFSPPDTAVTVSGRTTAAGYVVWIADRGFGLADDQLAEARQRIARGPVFGYSGGRTMGLDIVGVLAARHGIEVSFVGDNTGTVATVRLPPAIVQPHREPPLRSPNAAAAEAIAAAPEPTAPAGEAVAEETVLDLDNTSATAITVIDLTTADPQPTGDHDDRTGGHTGDHRGVASLAVGAASVCTSSRLPRRVRGARLDMTRPIEPLDRPDPVLEPEVTDG